MAATQRDIINTNFQKFEKFGGVEFRRWQKKMHFLLTTLKVVYVLSTPRPPEEEEKESLETSRRRIKWDYDDYICRGHILNVKNSHKRKKEDLSMEQLGRRLQIEEGIKLREGDNSKKNDLPIFSINVMEEGQSSGTKKNKKRLWKFTKGSKFQKKPKDKKVGSCWECGGPHFKRDCPKVKKKKAQLNGHPNGGQDNQG
ncbi:unnamed protein product [Cuscuta europaea]|uniref:Zinc finger, CCHC-type n=1 Tax=Cuscuta europaea TaxID=41803 RepID=A0A9P0ZQ71_CUSEU|nr:unnamed protein product [Cuscuta europaea]